MTFSYNMIMFSTIRVSTKIKTIPREDNELEYKWKDWSIKCCQLTSV